MEENNQKLFTFQFFLPAGECNPEREMPVTLLVERLIEVATLAANSWQVGYATLIKSNEGWVLSRLTTQMKRYPRVNEHYSISTWIDGVNSHYSQRCFEICGEQGEVIGYARSIWMIINYETRRAADLSAIGSMASRVLSKPCPITTQSRARITQPTQVVPYTFKYCDCDVNRHVNTVRYIELLLNQLPLEQYEHNQLTRLELTFMRESRYADEVQVQLQPVEGSGQYLMSIADGQSARIRALLAFTPRELIY